MIKRIILLAVSVFVFGLVSTASAHEFIIKPQLWNNYTSGQTVPFSVSSCHIFMTSEEIEPIQHVAVTFNGAKLDLTENKSFLTLDGAVKLEKAGTAVLAGHREGIIWSKTTKGWVEGLPKDGAGLIFANKYEKFAKALLPVDGDSTGFDTVVGHQLEIVPVDDPAKAHAGDLLRVKILYNGQPLSTEVFATYDGFTDTPNSYAYYTECDDQGIATIKLTSTGLWMVRVQAKEKLEDPKLNEHVIRSVLVFPVK